VDRGSFYNLGTRKRRKGGELSGGFFPAISISGVNGRKYCMLNANRDQGGGGDDRSVAKGEKAYPLRGKHLTIVPKRNSAKQV